MNRLLKFRESLIKFFNKADIYLLPALKFLLAFLLFYGINNNYGYMESISGIFVAVILAIVSALLPLSGTVAIGMLLIVIHCFGIGIEIGALAAGIYLILFILIIRFVPKDSIAILLTPFAFKFNMQAAVPISLGLLGKGTSALTAVCSVISYFFLKELPLIAELKKTEGISELEVLKQAIASITNNMTLIVYAIVFAAVVLVVYLIRKLCTTYGWLLSIIIGSAVYISLLLCGSVFLEIRINIYEILIGTAVSAGAALVLTFFKFNVDYSGSRYLQFEDDDFYYYVKAIPKNRRKEDSDDEGVSYFEEDYYEDTDESEEELVKKLMSKEIDISEPDEENEK